MNRGTLLIDNLHQHPTPSLSAPLSLSFSLSEYVKIQKNAYHRLYTVTLFTFFYCYCPTHHPQENWQVSIIVEVVQLVKNMPAMQETKSRSLRWEDPLEKGMATHSNILAWRIPTKEPGRLQSMGSQELDQTQRLNHHY